MVKLDFGLVIDCDRITSAKVPALTIPSKSYSISHKSEQCAMLIYNESRIDSYLSASNITRDKKQLDLSRLKVLLNTATSSKRSPLDSKLDPEIQLCVSKYAFEIENRNLFSPSEDLIKAINTALTSDNPYSALRTVFATFGYWVIKKTIVGDKLEKTCKFGKEERNLLAARIFSVCNDKRFLNTNGNDNNRASIAVKGKLYLCGC